METVQQKLNRLRNIDKFKKMRELNKLKLRLSNINYNKKNITYDDLPKNQREFIENRKIKNENIETNRKILDPEFINISSMRPENQLIIKDNLEDVYNSGDLVLKDTIKNEFDKIDKEFKNNLLLLMNLKNADKVMELYVNDFTFKRFLNINFPDLKKQLKEKYNSLDINEFLFFIKEWYKNPKKLSIKNAIIKKFNDIRKDIKMIKRKILYKQLKYANNPEKLRYYKNQEATLMKLNEDLEDENFQIKDNEDKLIQFNTTISNFQSKINNILTNVSETNEGSEISEQKKKN